MKRTFALLATMAATSASAHAAKRGPTLIQRIRLDYIETYIEEAAVKERLEPALLRALIRVESNFNHKATSRVGAKGLMQIMPFTAEELGNKKALDRHNPRANILAGTHYLRELINRFDGKLNLALAAYNAGPNAVAKYKGIPPFSETRSYVRKVLDQLDDERRFVADSSGS
ncbi:MAG: lytic transglycosylase domain-containing protein [Bdellovibrionota bacterium]